MGTCEVCGNDYDKAFTVTMNRETHTFDSFECAIQALAPICSHCGCRIIGHGMEAGGEFYCCAHCAEESGITQMRDRPKKGNGDAREKDAEARPQGEAGRKVGRHPGR